MTEQDLVTAMELAEEAAPKIPCLVCGRLITGLPWHKGHLFGSSECYGMCNLCERIAGPPWPGDSYRSML